MDRDGINLVGGIDAVINANIQSGSGSNSSATSKQVTRIVQHGGNRRGAGGSDRDSRTYTGENDKEVQQ